MPELVAPNRLKLAALLLVAVLFSSFFAIHVVSMWEKASLLSKDGSTSLGAYEAAANWLSQNLRESETALVPMREVFVALAPQLRERLIEYKSLWNASGVVLKADTTQEQILKVRDYLVYFLREDYQIRYVLRDWVDPYARQLFEATTSDDLMFLLHEVNTIPFTLSTGWGSQMTIYERMQFTPLFAVKFSTRPPGSFRSPSDTVINFTSDGAEIRKVVEDVRFYLPLQASINTSLQLTYFTLLVQPNVENLTMTVVFYYDANGDGKYLLNTPEQPSPDYTKGVIFSGLQLDWTSDDWYSISHMIPESYDPIVQIAFIMKSTLNGTITLADLVVYTETTSQVVFSEASQWLAEHLREDEVAIVPSASLFFSGNPNLEGKLIDYSSFWRASNVTLRAYTTIDDKLKVRSYFVDFLKTNLQVKYVLRDWINPYAENIYEVTTGDELMLQLQQIQEMAFKVGSGWTLVVTLYEKMRYTKLLVMNFTSAPQRYYTIPSNASVNFDSNGVTISKADTRVGFYLPLEMQIDPSNQPYLTMQFKLDVESVDLILGFYYDVNGDGVWSGYDIDYYSGVKQSQTQQGWIKGQWYQLVQSIPMAAAPLVQIAVITDLGTTGTITLLNMITYRR